MHNTIFQVSTSPISDDEMLTLTQALDENILDGIADSMGDDVNYEERLGILREKLEHLLGDLVEFAPDESYVVFHNGAIDAYFKNRVMRFRTLLKKLYDATEDGTFDAIEFDLFRLNECVVDRFEKYIYINGEAVPLDVFMTNIEPEQRYYFGACLDYHW